MYLDFAVCVAHSSSWAGFTCYLVTFLCRCPTFLASPESWDLLCNIGFTFRASHITYSPPSDPCRHSTLSYRLTLQDFLWNLGASFHDLTRYALCMLVKFSMWIMTSSVWLRSSWVSLDQYFSTSYCLCFWAWEKTLYLNWDFVPQLRFSRTWTTVPALFVSM